MGVLDGVSYLQEGQGEDLVFLHGYLACKESFAYQIAYFSRFFRVTAFDFPGMGKSEPLASPWSVGEYAEHARGSGGAGRGEGAACRPFLRRQGGAQTPVRIARTV